MGPKQGSDSLLFFEKVLFSHKLHNVSDFENYTIGLDILRHYEQ